MKPIKWVLIDSTLGATTKNHSKLSPEALHLIAEAVQDQVNHEFAAEWGAKAKIRVGTINDVKPGEWAYKFLPELPDDPDDVAIHDITKKGVPYALCGFTTCGSLFGPDGVSVDVSHEILETAGDVGANQFAFDNNHLLHAFEMCDAVEMQTYRKTCKDGTVVHVSNWLLPSWFTPGAAGPYDYMTSEKIRGAVAPPGPFKTAPGHGGNYQLISKWGGDKGRFAATNHIAGTRRKGDDPNWSSRAAKRLKEIARLNQLAKSRA